MENTRFGLDCGGDHFTIITGDFETHKHEAMEFAYNVGKLKGQNEALSRLGKEKNKAALVGGLIGFGIATIWSRKKYKKYRVELAKKEAEEKTRKE